MSFFFGRRHSVSGAPPPGGLHEQGFFHRLFERHQHSEATDPAVVTGVHDTVDKNNTALASKEQASSEKLPEPSHVKSTAKPHRHRHVITSSEPQLSNKDIAVLFSGAPYFLLEGNDKTGHFSPQVIFPFDDHDPFVQNLWDRKPLAHASYTLCTLHAHLPLPDGWVIRGETPIRPESWKRTGAPKRASFDVGIFETPNMLSMNGKDPGSVGYRHFLELPVSDSARYIGPARLRPMLDYVQLSRLPAIKAYELMEHYNDPYSRCADGTVHDRKQLLREGPSAWRSIGVRDIDLNSLVARLQNLTSLRHEILHGKRVTTILERESAQDLSNELFTKFLYPLPRFLWSGVDNPHGIKAQIKALTVVLATPGAWVDFSLVEWRLRAGQLLWEAAPHADGDFFDPSVCQKPWMHPTIERKWYLVQMLLAAELLLRLDATVRVGILGHSNELSISSEDIHYFNVTRNAKVDWDIVVLRRLVDSFNASYSPNKPGIASGDNSLSSTHPSDKQHHRVFDGLFHRQSSPSKVGPESSWNCHLVPTRISQQLQGLFVFAENIGWPGLEALKERLCPSIGNFTANRTIVDAYNSPVHNAVPDGLEMGSRVDEMYSRSPSRRRLLLHCSQDPLEIGGWITRSWLSGFVIPGEMVSHILMATILENDPAAMAQLGPLANLYGGFSYSGRSWWSKQCFIARVLASLEGTKECMGWLSSPILPRDSQTSEDIHSRWFEVVVKPAPRNPGVPRIKQGKKVALDSTFLPSSNLMSGAFSLPTDGPMSGESKVKITFETLDFSGHDEQPLQGEPHLVVYKASMSFCLNSDILRSPRTVSFPLTFNVNFIASYGCRPPAGFAPLPASPSMPGTNHNTSSASHKHHRLPGHPLHSKYSYKVIPIDALAEPDALEKFSEEDSVAGLERRQVIVLDARGSRDKETFARAWCASAGYNAIIGRVGRTCLACCIREACAISVKIVIRVDDGPSCRTPCVQTIPMQEANEQ
ncbi:hypothetical protein EYZ11_009941 [Aspergillus tanneri]|uniref:Uncharacterized protein n=1 Tax=Aspergillus tanneri TaxID=1220188 RepID=A0A4S3J6L0_9EURO|nr:hypothetical protein EYZ11_009941 [Aspergillus tanneri]